MDSVLRILSPALFIPPNTTYSGMGPRSVPPTIPSLDTPVIPTWPLWVTTLLMYIICIYSLCWLAGIIIFFLSFFPLFLSFFLWLNWRSITSHLGSQDRKLCRTTYVCVWFCYLDRASATKMPNSGSGSLPTLIRITGYYFYGWLVVGRRNRSSGLFTCHHHLFLFFFPIYFVLKSSRCHDCLC